MRFQIAAVCGALSLGSACSLDTDRFTFGGATGGGGSGGEAGSGTGLTGAVGAQGGGGGATDCTSNAQCDDDVVCNGIETCANGTCAAGAPLTDGTRCTPRRPLPDEDYVCVSGECVQSCTTDEECDDGSSCSGIETCSPVTQTCVAGQAVVCSDGDLCTEDICDEVEGCQFILIDGDGDGFADEALGACGLDCDDNDDEVYPLAPELCDAKDNNCDTVIDEGTPIWYPDCDADGFAADGAVGVPGCDVPPMAPAACPGTAPAATWTATEPVGLADTDCWDLDNRAHPYTSSQNVMAWKSSAINGAPSNVDFDFNCDGIEEKRYNVAGKTTSSTCAYEGSPFAACLGAGWIGVSSAACGSTASYIGCNTQFGCNRFTTTQTQECR